MLKHIAIQNFVHFHQRQHLQFEKGPNFIIGGNSSGKSSIFELTRRCLSHKLSKTSSSIPDAEKVAFVLCEFELCSTLSSKIVKLANLKRQENWKPSKCYSGILVNNREETDTTKQMYKFVCILDHDDVHDKSHIFLESNYFPLAKGVEWKALEIDIKDMTSAAEYIKNIVNDHDIANEIASDSDNKLLNLFRCETQPVADGSESLCEQVLEIFRDKCVQVFPLGSATQWSNSKSFTEKHQSFASVVSILPPEDDEQNEYIDPSKTDDEILCDLLDSKHVEETIAEEIFTSLTAPQNYKFVNNNGSHKVICDEREIPLLKAPVGVKKAKQFSLLLAHKEYQTICLDEPDLGMHPHMVEKMRDLVLRSPHCEDKVVIFISHNPYMISTWNLDRIHVCRRTNYPKVIHRVIKVNDSQGIGLLLRHEMKNILFASSVMFVEGITDKLILSSVFDEVLKSGIPKYREKEKQMKQIICGMQILQAKGQTSYTKCSNITRDLGVPHVFVQDKDVFFTPDSKKNRGLYRRELLFVCKEEKASNQSEARIQTLRQKGEIDLVDCLEAFKRKQTSNLREKTKEFLKKHVYVIGKPNKERIERIYLGKEVADKDIKEELNRKNVFYWDNGDLEDIICESIIMSEMSDQKKWKMLFAIFCDDSSKKKSSLLDMKKGDVEKLSSCLINSTEMLEFFKFLTKYPPFLS